MITVMFGVLGWHDMIGDNVRRTDNTWSHSVPGEESPLLLAEENGSPRKHRRRVLSVCFISSFIGY